MERRVPPRAKAEALKDREGLSSHDPGAQRVLEEGLAWLARAQDLSTSADGGVARHYSLVSGWSASYPETTGYIVPTMIAGAQQANQPEYLERARRMLDWLVGIQFPEGGFQGGEVDAQPRVPVTFNTGQILLGLVAGVKQFSDPRYRNAMSRAAEWLVETQDEDGCWRKHPTPFAAPGEKAYETHVAWGLLEAARTEARQDWADAALRNIRWSLTHHRSNGWIDLCCLADPSRPLTHTLAYALRGVVEAYRFSQEPEFLRAAEQTSRGLMGAMDSNGFLPGRLDADWNGAAAWACLTGTSQAACCWFLLRELTGDPVYSDAARCAARYVRRTVKIDGSADTRGAVKGAFPVDGDYGRFEYLNWACKFLVDANLLETADRTEAQSTGDIP
jgi:hypothetical protein